MSFLLLAFTFSLMYHNSCMFACLGQMKAKLFGKILLTWIDTLSAFIWSSVTQINEDVKGAPHTEELGAVVVVEGWTNHRAQQHIQATPPPLSYGLLNVFLVTTQTVTI